MWLADELYFGAFVTFLSPQAASGAPTVVTVTHSVISFAASGNLFFFAPGTLVCIYYFRVRPSLFIFRSINSSFAGSSCLRALFLRFSVQSFYKQPSHLADFRWLSVYRTFHFHKHHLEKNPELIKKWRHFGSAAAARLPLLTGVLRHLMCRPKRYLIG